MNRNNYPKKCVVPFHRSPRKLNTIVLFTLWHVYGVCLYKLEWLKCSNTENGKQRGWIYFHFFFLFPINTVFNFWICFNHSWLFNTWYPGLLKAKEKKRQKMWYLKQMEIVYKKNMKKILSARTKISGNQKQSIYCKGPYILTVGASNWYERK